MSPTGRPDWIAEALDRVVATYPAAMFENMSNDRTRTRYHVELIAAATKPGGAVADIGGGLSMFAPVMAIGGYRVTLFDDFADPGYPEHRAEVLGTFRELGVQIIEGDAAVEVARANGSFDAVGCFDVLEHWHHSPRAMLHAAVGRMAPNGRMVIGMPNCVDLKRRVTTLFGNGKWTPFEEWYDQPVFRSHVREADVDDLRRMATDLGLANVDITGRNWGGTEYSTGLVRAVSRAIDPLLRLRPSLCSALYLIGHRPTQGI